MNALIINHTDIKTDAHGRFSLNSLHHAAGGNPKHQPALFLRNDRTKRLIATLEKEADLSSTDSQTLNPVDTVLGKGKEQGTYVVKELVYSYASWISPEFELKVIRAYDTLVQGGPVAVESPSETVRALAQAVQSNAKLVAMLERTMAQLAAANAEEEIVVVRRKPRPLTAENKAEIIALAAKNWSGNKIAAHTGRSTATVSMVLGAWRTTA